MNPFTALPPKVRAWIYYATFVLGVGIGGTELGFDLAEHAYPLWLRVAAKELPFVASAFAITAASNTITRARRVFVEPVQVQPEAVQAIAAKVSEQIHRDARGRFVSGR